MQRSIKPDGDFQTVKRLVEKLQKRSSSATSPKTALERAYIAMQSTYLGDYVTTSWALGPYLVEAQGEIRTNDDVLLKIQSTGTQADLLVETALLMDHNRRYKAAVGLLQRAIDLYQGEEEHYAKANAYHWLSFVMLHQHDFQESEKCELKRMELVYQRANREMRRLRTSNAVQFSHLIATSRMWLGVLAQRQGALAKAKTELFTARELFLTTAEATGKKSDLRSWGDLHSTLGRVYSSEGKYDDAIEETQKALNFYIPAKHLIFETQTRINLARIYIKRMMGGEALGENRAKAKDQLDLAAEILEKKLPEKDRRTTCLLNLTYCWYHYACCDWTSSERIAQKAIRDAKNLGSRFFLAECHRARADVAIQLNKFPEARRDLQIAMQQLEPVGRYKTLASVLLTFAKSYCSHVEPNRVEVDKYLDRFLELKSEHPFESHYLESVFDKLKRDCLELPSQRAFYFSIDDLESGGYDAGLSKYLVWAIGCAQRAAHGDVKKLSEILHFNTLTRAYKYIKLARAVELGNKQAAEKVNKTHTIRPVTKD